MSQDRIEPSAAVLPDGRLRVRLQPQWPVEVIHKIMWEVMKVALVPDESGPQRVGVDLVCLFRPPRPEDEAGEGYSPEAVTALAGRINAAIDLPDRSRPA